MPNALYWTTPAAIQTPIGTGLNSLANNARVVSGTMTVTREQYADAELLVTFPVTPSTNGYVSLYVMPTLDGTNFADGDATLGPAANMQVGTFAPQASTSAQRLVIRQIVLPAVNYRWLLWNRAGQAFAASGNTLRTRTYSPEVQS
jgi:hypothetical protein